VSASGIISVILFLIGALTLFVNIVGGAVVIILVLLIGMQGGKKTVMICPCCSKEGTRLAQQRRIIAANFQTIKKGRTLLFDLLTESSYSKLLQLLKILVPRP